MLCLDTTFIIDLLREKKDALSKFEAIKDHEVYTTILNVYELKAGIQRKFQPHIILRESAAFNKFLANITIFDLNLNSIDKAAEINGELTNQGLIIEDFDILIAGICLANGCSKIITKNVKHFSRIKGLKVETY